MSSAPTSTADFADLILKSGVMEQARLASYLDTKIGKEARSAEPSWLAGRMIADGVLTSFQADQLMRGKWKRFVIGKYRVLEPIGSGGTGKVFLCEHVQMRRKMAVKILMTNYAENDEVVNRFNREARAVAALDHPNLVHAYDVGHEGRVHYLVMEYVDGVSLNKLVARSGPLAVARACHYVAEAAAGLQCAFEAGLVHRDVKPANIMVDRSGRVILLDLGLARFVGDGEEVLTKKDSILGTADYLAPEQALDSHNVDIRADIYSFGATLYYLLSGSPPFPAKTAAQKIIQRQFQMPRPVRELRPNVPESVARVVERMLRTEPDERYATPQEVITALRLEVTDRVSPPTDPELALPSRASFIRAADAASTAGAALVTRIGERRPAPAGAAP